MGGAGSYLLGTLHSGVIHSDTHLFSVSLLSLLPPNPSGVLCHRIYRNTWDPCSVPPGCLGARVSDPGIFYFLGMVHKQQVTLAQAVEAKGWCNNTAELNCSCPASSPCTTRTHTQGEGSVQPQWLCSGDSEQRGLKVLEAELPTWGF
jgi:hypothetical protein